jgi:hypothetical protein
MRSYRRARRLLGTTALAVAVLVALAPVAGATTAPPKVQVTVTDDFSSGSIRFVVAGVPSVLEADTYKVGLTNNSIGPHVLVAVGGLPEDLTEDEFIQVLDEVNAGAPPPAGAFEAGAVFAKPGQAHQKLFDLTSPGQYGYFCPIPTPAGIPHYKLGFVGFFDVTAD